MKNKEEEEEEEEEKKMHGRPQFGVGFGLSQQLSSSSLSSLGKNNESRDRNPSSAIGSVFPSELPQQLASPISTRLPPPPPPLVSGDGFDKQLAVVAMDEEVAEDDGYGYGRSAGGGNRWPRQETLALLKIRSEMDAAFRDATVKAPLWEDVSRKLAELGYHRSAKKCKEKFENVTKYYKRTRDGRSGRHHGKTYRFFKQMEALYTDGNRSSNITCAAEKSSGALQARDVTKAAEEDVHDRATQIKSHPAPDLSAISFSTESSDEYDEDTDNFNNNNSSERTNRKRKRTSMEKMTTFFEKLMEAVLHKQETMQQRFLEMIEKREQDRMIREEAWKRQEMARLSRETELRSQERALSASRDTALVAFLHRVTGQTLKLPKYDPVPQPATALARAPPQQIHQAIYDREPASAFDPNSKRWPKQEVQALIKLRSGFESRFHEAGPKAQLWEQISSEMAAMGYHRSSKRCKEKWENINKYFRKAKESNKERPEKANTCPYFHQLDSLYGKGILKFTSYEKERVGGGIRSQDQQEELLEQISNREDQSPHNENSATTAATASLFSADPSPSNTVKITENSDVIDPTNNNCYNNQPPAVSEGLSGNNSQPDSTSTVVIVKEQHGTNINIDQEKQVATDHLLYVAATEKDMTAPIDSSIMSMVAN